MENATYYNQVHEKKVIRFYWSLSYNYYSMQWIPGSNCVWINNLQQNYASQKYYRPLQYVSWNNKTNCQKRGTVKKEEITQKRMANIWTSWAWKHLQQNYSFYYFPSKWEKTTKNIQFVALQNLL